jgi:phosphotransferase system  glucose/maltose/N-acetylglucosamine-specific IIC component
VLKRRLPGGWWPEFFTALTAMIGAGLCLYGMRLAPFSDEARAMEAFAAACNDAGSIDGWWRAVDVYRTPHDALMNAGLGLIFAGATIELLRLALLFPSRRGWPALRTPQERWMFLAIGVGIVWTMLYAAVAGLELDLQRFMFPACADSIGIPIMGLGAMTLVATFVLPLVGWAVMSAFGNLPVSLMRWDAARPRRSWIVSLLFGGLILAGTVEMIGTLGTSAALGVPPTIIALYLLASTRAALLARPDNRDRNASGATN